MKMESGFSFQDSVTQPVVDMGSVAFPGVDWENTSQVRDVDDGILFALLPGVWDLSESITRVTDVSHPGIALALLADDLMTAMDWACRLRKLVALAVERYHASDTREWTLTVNRLLTEPGEPGLGDDDLVRVYSVVERVLSSGRSELIQLDDMPVDVRLAKQGETIQITPIF